VLVRLDSQDVTAGVEGVLKGKSGAFPFVRSSRTSTLAAVRRNHSLVDAGHCFLHSEGDSKAPCLPSLICIGAMKAGTFELKQWLSEHPLVKTSAKERHFFGQGRPVDVEGIAQYAKDSPEWLLTKNQIEKVCRSGMASSCYT